MKDDLTIKMVNGGGWLMMGFGKIVGRLKMNVEEMRVRCGGGKQKKQTKRAGTRNMRKRIWSSGRKATRKKIILGRHTCVA